MKTRANIGRCRADAAVSISAFTSSTGLRSKVNCLYMEQKVQRFQVQPRVTRTSRLFASLGGRQGGKS